MTKVIEVENLGKKYIISHQQERYTALRDVMANSAKKIAKTIVGKKESLPKREEFWALRNVSFEVNQGDRIGIIGRNGAGKSTLLKLLSKITEPTEGKIKIKGRLASLLEVGTGFHNELTGRENIYLNGAILGMSKREIKKKFDEIVEFSGVEKFLDTPVKRYSSGMYVRLAFAIAANLEPDILLVDEVLAVGDAEFQKKCLGKMEDISTREGRTVVFVSHNMGAINSLTKSCLWLENGKIFNFGPTENIVEKYFSFGISSSNLWEAKEFNNNPIQIIRAEISTKNNSFNVSEDLIITLNYIVREKVSNSVISVIIESPDGNAIISTEDIDTNLELLEKRNVGVYESRVIIPGNWLSSGSYILKLHSGVVFQCIFDYSEVLKFELFENGNPKIRNHKKAYLLPYLDWSVKKIK